jgi:hypothetical protein
MRVISFLAFFVLAIFTLAGGCVYEQRAIIGRISYSGEQTGMVMVIATRPGEEGLKSRYAIGMNHLGSYQLNVRTGTYTVFAYMDMYSNC